MTEPTTIGSVSQQIPFRMFNGANVMPTTPSKVGALSTNTAKRVIREESGEHAVLHKFEQKKKKKMQKKTNKTFFCPYHMTTPKSLLGPKNRLDSRSRLFRPQQTRNITTQHCPLFVTMPISVSINHFWKWIFFEKLRQKKIRGQSTTFWDECQTWSSGNRFHRFADADSVGSSPTTNGASVCLTPLLCLTSRLCGKLVCGNNADIFFLLIWKPKHHQHKHPLATATSFNEFNLLFVFVSACWFCLLESFFRFFSLHIQGNWSSCCSVFATQRCYGSVRQRLVCPVCVDARTSRCVFSALLASQQLLLIAFLCFKT